MQRELTELSEGYASEHCEDRSHDVVYTVTKVGLYTAKVGGYTRDTHINEQRQRGPRQDRQGSRDNLRASDVDLAVTIVQISWAPWQIRFCRVADDQPIW